MAALFQPADNSEHATPREESFNEETLDQSSCDVILVVEDGKEFKAHKRVLSEASPFFEKMLESDMKESKEGIVRLEMFSESVMRDTLEFIYTGSVQILTEHNAQELIVIADYLFLHNLKTLAEEAVLEHKVNTSNCIPTYCFSQRYRCEGLFAKSKTFILANFAAVYEANPEEILDLSSQEIEMWISSDEIDVSAEEDVFKIILAWIDRDESKRKKHFAELFRQVRLVYVSRDFLCRDIVTNDLVKDNEGCLDLVEEAMRLIDSKDFGNLSVTPRKSLETPVIITCTKLEIEGNGCDLQCYLPREDRWCSLGEFEPSYLFEDHVSCRGKLYRVDPECSSQLTCYDLYSNSSMQCMPLPQEDDMTFREIFVSNEDEMYALVGLVFPPYIMKYKHESNSWEVISLFDNYELTKGCFCIVAKDNFIYVIDFDQEPQSIPGVCYLMPRTYVHRYDLGRYQWDTVASLQERKEYPSGAVANGKIFVAGKGWMSEMWQCDVYNETTNEWQFIAFNVIPGERIYSKLLSVDGTLFALYMWKSHYSDLKVALECYDPDKNEWHRKTEIYSQRPLCRIESAHACSVKIFKGFLNRQLKSFPKYEHACRLMVDAIPPAPGASARSDDPLSWLYQEPVPPAPTSGHLVNQRRDEVDGRLSHVDAIPPNPGSSVRGDQPLNEESVDLEFAPAPVRSTKRKCCFIM